MATLLDGIEKSMTALLDPFDHPPAGGSKDWYALEILGEMAELRQGIERGQPEQAAEGALHLGLLLMEAHFQLAYGRWFETGVKQFLNLAEMRRAMNARRRAEANTRHQEWIEEGEAIWKRNPRLGVSECSRRVIAHKMLNAAPKTVADVIRPFCPRPRLGPANKVGDAR